MRQEGRNLNMTGLKVLLPTSDASNSFSDELASRKAEEAAKRRNQAAEWLRKMDNAALECLSKEPLEKEFCSSLRNGIILCNVLNKINPGAVPKIVDNLLTAQSTEGAAQSVIQYFENVRNFLVAVGNMKLLTFQASDLEKGGSSSKVVDCILCMKGYHEWKQSGAVGEWRYGGTVKIASFPKSSTSSLSVGSESADESFDEYESSQNEQLSEIFHLSNKVSFEDSKEAKALSVLFDQYGLGILEAYLTDKIGTEDFSLNIMMIDAVIGKVVQDFSAALVSQGIQLGILLKKILQSEITSLSNEEFLDAVSKYLSKQAATVCSDPFKFCIRGGKAEIINSTLPSLSHEELSDAISQYLSKQDASESSDASELCICGGKGEIIKPIAAPTANYKELIKDQQKQLEELRSSFCQSKQEAIKVQLAWDEEVRLLGNQIKSLEVASSSYQKLLEENRRLYNQVQDLKGTIRVYCRVKPFSPGQSYSCSTIDHIGENGNIMIVHPRKQGKEARKVFSFNKVYAPNMNQQQIYADIQPLIRSVLDGYNVCIFAYGQTGSGKTYTMSGPDLTEEETWGVNYRALSDLFQISKSRASVMEYNITVQMIEIYNEQVRDLLVIDGSMRRLDIRNSSPMNALNVPDASLVPVDCPQDVLDLMRIGQMNRSVGATALNERSSRSHSILTVHIQGKELLSGTILSGCLHLVDLAGSERVDKSEAIGERLREAQHINKSLSALGDVISALAKKCVHIPYRNSKLTQVLQGSLGGQAKTLMFVHINPESDAIGETISTLTFAERVASVELGTVKTNRETTEIQGLKEEISNLKLVIEKKEAGLEHIHQNTNKRSSMEPQKARSVSPLQASALKPDSVQGSYSAMNSKSRSYSSGKQRKSHFPSVYIDKETTANIPQLDEETIASSRKLSTPSPLVRRTLFTDRGSLTRSKIKPEMALETKKLHFPARVSMNRSILFSKNSSTAKEGITKGLAECEDEKQLKQALSVRQESAMKTKQEPQLSSNKSQKPEATGFDMYKMENDLNSFSSPAALSN